jgi:hypothetical protein
MARGNGREHQQQKPDRQNYFGVRQGGKGSYEASVIAKRRERARVMARNNTPETEAINEESTRAVVEVLSRKDLFPWIESVELEEDRLGDDDWIRKTDAYVNIVSEFGRLGLLDQYRIQIKSGWGDLAGLGNKNIKKLLSLTSKEWRELGLVILFGQATSEAIAASFCDQMINYMEIAGIGDARWEFTRLQTPELQKIMTQYEALDIAGRDWAVLLSWITGNPRRVERTQGGGQVVFL